MGNYQSFTFNNERRDYIVMPVGRKRPAWAPIKRNFLTAPHKPGAFLINTEIGVRQIDVPLIIKSENIADLQKVKEDLADWLFTEEPVELIFDDEKDRTYLAVIDGELDLDELVNRGKGVITFICSMPYKLGANNTHDFVQNWSTETTAYFTNKGSVEAPPIIEIDVKKPSTFLDVWFGEYPNKRDYFRIGYPLTVEETTVQERERVLWDQMSSLIGWTPVTGQVEEMKGTGEIKVKDGTAFYCPYYGAEGTQDFHGGLIKKSIPGGPLQNFELEARVHLQSRHVDQMGRVEVLLLDETSNVVARINMNDLYGNAEITKAYMRIGNGTTPNSIRKLADTSGAHPNTFNNFHGRLRIARRGKEWSVYVARFRDGTEIDDASFVERWTDDTENPMTNRKVAQVMIAICRFNRNTPVYTMQVDDLKIWKVNNVGDKMKPFIYEAGDKIVIDTAGSLVTINGKDAVNLKDIFSNFPTVIRGRNRLDIMPPDVKATISYRERYR
ncbi:distal tail protein Dit [Bacillus mycoides]|uniref:Phage tail protein n=1 Tax=Bacillus cereus VD021 TaxID=1053224 RepID=R8GY02_BACCE|nr:distal tail protein Dit [Bacillus cereus]EOO65468.1 hypothetical protein IIC_06078 [Bacillus cereus VD021]